MNVFQAFPMGRNEKPEWRNAMTAEECRQRAAQCHELADQTNSTKFKKIFTDEAQAWLRLAEDQERVVTRASERLARVPREAAG
jgi:hypothetical protein